MDIAIALNRATATRRALLEAQQAATATQSLVLLPIIAKAAALVADLEQLAFALREDATETT